MGDYCTHGGGLHKCNTAIPDGEPWNAAHWTATTVAAELLDLINQLSAKIGAKNGLKADTDLNSLFDAGFYYTNTITTSTILNAPYNVAFSVYVIRADTSSANRAMQIAFPLSSSDISLKYRKFVSNNWTEWLPIATATPPQEFDLPLAEGVSAVSSAYWKDQFGVVTGHFNVLASSSQTGSSPVIATLPEGFRPSRQANATAVVSSGESLGLLVRQTGEIQLQDAASVTLEGKYVKGLFSFVSAS